MTILTSLILIGAIILVALAIAYNVQKGTKTLEELRANFYDNEAEQETVETVTKASKGVVITSEEVTKPKKKRKYYPKKPKTSI